MDAQNTQNSTEKMPAGMIVIVVLLGLSFVEGLFGLPQNFAMISSGSGLFIFQGFVGILSMIISAFVIAGIYQRRWWRAIVAWKGFNLVLSVAVFAVISLTPVGKLLEITGGKDISTTSTVVNAAIEGVVKSTVGMVMIVSTIVSLIIFIYIYKKRSYFKS